MDVMTAPTTPHPARQRKVDFGLQRVCAKRRCCGRRRRRTNSRSWIWCWRRSLLMSPATPTPRKRIGGGCLCTRGPRKLRVEIADFGPCFQSLGSRPTRPFAGLGRSADRRLGRIPGEEHGGFHRLPARGGPEHPVLYFPSMARATRTTGTWKLSNFFVSPCNISPNVSLYNVSTTQRREELQKGGTRGD